MPERFDNILQTIGRTPVVRINKLGPHHVNLFVKVESFNPMGSIKDRLALGVIEDAEQRGTLKPGQTVVEATSGNTGIGLAMVCAQKGYPLVVTMAENFSVERRKLMRFLGARVVLTPAALKGSGMVAKAEELASQHGWFLTRQFENPANAEVHARTTAREILAAFAGERLDYWVTGYGTGGTLNGVSRVLRRDSPQTQIVVCEPDNSAILASGIAQDRNADGSHRASHSTFRPHLMQGWSPDFVPQLIEEVTQDRRIDRFLGINGSDALQCARNLARQEGIFVGTSSGATFAGALMIAAEAPEGANILCMLPDTGERYLSTALFEDVPAEMTDEEQSISRSTSGYRFDVQVAPGTANATTAEPDPEALRELAALVSSKDAPVVMFALEWCEFCWSARKMLTSYGIDYKAVALDSADYAAGDRGGKLREALRVKTGWNTIPQIFIGGEFVGGCTDLFGACKTGDLANRLIRHAIPFDAAASADPYGFLPGWLQPR